MEEPIRVVYEHREEYEKRKRKEEHNQLGIFFKIIFTLILIYSIFNLPDVDAIIGTILGIAFWIFVWKTRKKK